MFQKIAHFAAMVPTAATEMPNKVSSLKEEYLKAFRFMLLARLVDEKMATLYRAGKIFGGVYIGRGQEAISVALGISLQKGDVYAPLIRDGAGRLAFGEPLLDGIRTYMGSVLGPMRGRDGNVHRGRPKEGLLPMISHLGAMISVVNGVLMARRFKKIDGTVGGTTIGDGATSTGAFHEAINQAAIEKLPLVLVVVNNRYAYSTPNSRQFACEDLVDRAIGYGVQGHNADGTDLANCLDTLHAAVTNAREGKGPQLVVADLLRLCGHGEHDDAHYIDASLKKSAIGCDCLKVAEDHMVKQNWAQPGEIQMWRAESTRIIEEAVATVQREAAPDGYRENWQAISSKHLIEVFPEIS